MRYQLVVFLHMTHRIVAGARLQSKQTVNAYIKTFPVQIRLLLTRFTKYCEEHSVATRYAKLAVLCVCAICFTSVSFCFLPRSSGVRLYVSWKHSMCDMFYKRVLLLSNAFHRCMFVCSLETYSRRARSSSFERISSSSNSPKWKERRRWSSSCRRWRARCLMLGPSSASRSKYSFHAKRYPFGIR